jgi:hypothetical protein
VTKHPHDPGVIPDLELHRWTLVKDAAYGEMRWTHDRLNWLFSPQTILFAAYGLTLQESAGPPELLAALRTGIALLGVISSFVVLVVVTAAARMHLKWTQGMRSFASRYPNDLTFGSRPYWPAEVARWLPLLLPLCFCLVWLYVWKVQPGV